MANINEIKKADTVKRYVHDCGSWGVIPSEGTSADHVQGSLVPGVGRLNLCQCCGENLKSSDYVSEEEYTKIVPELKARAMEKIMAFNAEVQK
jgi:hypothetical protein